MIIIPNIKPEDFARLSKENQVFVLKALQEIAKRSNPQSKEFQKKYYHDPHQWVLDFVDIELSPYLVDVLKMVKQGHAKIAIFGPHGLGKSVLAAILVLWGGNVSVDCKIPTTASAWRQLEEYLWPEIHKWYHRVDWDKIEKAGGGKRPRLLTLECQFSDQSKAFAVASDNPETIEGAHARRIMYMFDEAKAIQAGTWESAEGAFSTPGDHLQFAFSTPGDTSGVFYNICSYQKGYEKWRVRHVTLREAIRGGRITLEWAREKREQWGADNPVYQNRVWGTFAKDSADSVIPLSWINLAINRWYAWKKEGEKTTGQLVIGADTAGQGVDKTKFYYRYDNVISKTETFKKLRPMEIAGKLKNAMGDTAKLNIDVSYGEGAGTADRLKEFEGFAYRIAGINFAEKTDRFDKSGCLGFANMRALLFWNMRELLDPDSGHNLCLPDEPLLIGDLCAIRRKTRSDGKMLVESKEDIRERIGRSTDDGDACALAFYEAEKGKLLTHYGRVNIRIDPIDGSYEVLNGFAIKENRATIITCQWDKERNLLHVNYEATMDTIEKIQEYCNSVKKAQNIAPPVMNPTNGAAVKNLISQLIEKKISVVVDPTFDALGAIYFLNTVIDSRKFTVNSQAKDLLLALQSNTELKNLSPHLEALLYIVNNIAIKVKAEDNRKPLKMFSKEKFEYQKEQELALKGRERNPDGSLKPIDKGYAQGWV
jgi:hypothetical protein